MAFLKILWKNVLPISNIPKNDLSQIIKTIIKKNPVGAFESENVEN